MRRTLDNTSSTSLTNQLFTSNYWHYAKQLLKGAGVFTVGLVGYFLLKKGYGNVVSESEIISSSNALVSSDNQQSIIKQLSVFSSVNQQPTNNAMTVPHSTIASQSLMTSEQTTSQETFDIRYPAKQQTKTIEKSVSKTQINQPTRLRKRSTSNEFQVSTYTTNKQWLPSVAALPNGNFVVTWHGSGLGDSVGVYAQLFDGSGNKLGNEFQVNTYTSGNQIYPSVVTFFNGNFVVTWDSENQDGDGYGIYGQIFDGVGNKIGSAFQVNTYTTGDQYGSSVTTFPNGNALVTWVSKDHQDGSWYGVFGQILDGLGNQVGSEFQVNTYIMDNQRDPSVATFSNGNFVVTWQSKYQDGSIWGVYSQLFDGSGNQVRSEFQVNTYTTNSQDFPSVATLSNGNAVVTWMSNWQDSDGEGIYGQLFNGTGNAIGSEFQVNTYTTGEQRYPSVATLLNNDFVVTWESDGQDGDGYGIYGQFFDNTGTKIGNEIRINDYTMSDQKNPAITCLTDGNIVIVWDSFGQDGDQEGIYGRLINPQIPLSAININTTRLYTEDTPYVLNDIIVKAASYNPNSFVTATLTVSNYKAGILNATTIINSNLTSVLSDTQGVWQVINPIPEMNTLLSSLVFQPLPNFDKNFTIAVDISDGISPDVTSTFTMRAIPVNDPPVLINNQLTIREGEQVILTRGNLNATDVDNKDVKLIFSVDTIKHGQFQEKEVSDVSITRFEQQQIVDGQIQFIHDGSTSSPSYQMSVSDGDLSTTPVFADITFTANTGKNVVAPVVGAIAGAVGIGLVTGIGFWRYRTHRANKQYRNQYPFANTLYEKLHLTDVVDFKSKAGQEFITTVNQLKTLFSEKHQLEVDNMAADAVDELATFVAKAIEEHVNLEKTRFGGQKMDMADVKSKADRIINSVQSVIEQEGWVPRQGPVMEKFDL